MTGDLSRIRHTSPRVPPCDASPPAPPDNASLPAPRDYTSPPAPRDNASPPVPRDNASPPVPRDNASPPVPRDNASPPVPRDNASPPVPRAVRAAGGARIYALSAIVAGLVAVAVSYAGPMVVVLAAAKAGGLTAGQTASWVWAISIGSGVVCVVVSLWARMPVVAAWSTPGAALLTTGFAEYGYAACVGAFVIAAIATLALGVTGWFGRVMNRLPAALFPAMLAGILLSFGLDVFHALAIGPLVPAVALGAYLIAKWFAARWAVVVALGAGTLAAVLRGRLEFGHFSWGLAHPVWTTPHFTLAAAVGLAIPLFVVTMASQNAPGLAVLRAAGYRPDDRALIGATGLTSLVLAPWGSHAINLAAITAAICTGPEAHPEPRRRYIAAVACGIGYLAVGTAGGALLAVFAGLPKELVMAIAGIALLGALLGSLSDALASPADREPALLTFLVTASGITLLGIGSAFWGLVLGVAVYGLTRIPRRVTRRGFVGSK
ncbi:benzoate/H(+) symporter BenE family transporter [Nocardia terpenica]|nr:benzoate/H(+) symporter BenE family transporter [Nocardia terpenica]MBF6062097.1 benzoate/H(+) symporter BenE family transporter [Nocardia terpenica]MBF6104185.1 benzoate/H(+) symporter BenE family transporter [Nocardia terpenica]MBF6109959.1 benzoate/H(+) symporter BenE family transporter [Nocardia terpenica]MBF6120265.1 benzoate/H(+) symporter BenE family transporter [Nocardia terpenica]MBF6152677.1 benzoate/H(+) symporter BenE family transporter [Nocardia terpenica]